MPDNSLQIVSRLWYMNADFEMELAATETYKRKPSFARINRRLAAHLLWLASPGDALIIESPSSDDLSAAANESGVDLVPLECAGDQSLRVFAPWGWTQSATEIGERVGAITNPIPIEIVRRVNSKLFSHKIEKELGILMRGAATASTIEELKEEVSLACPNSQDKWVIKSPLGFAARDRVLGRGPILDGPALTWSERRIAIGERLIFQPWLEVIREYGVVMTIHSNGETELHGVSDLQTNGAGTGFGYLLGRKVPSPRMRQLEEMALEIGTRLFREGYVGPVGFDALEHSVGLHPLLEINARYTMGFVALAIERATDLSGGPVFWSSR